MTTVVVNVTQAKQGLLMVGQRGGNCSPLTKEKHLGVCSVYVCAVFPLLNSLPTCIGATRALDSAVM